MTADSAIWLHEEDEGTSITPDIVDYKFLCYGGKAQCLFTCTGRAADDLRVDFYDLDWNRLPFTRHYPNADVPPEAPSGLQNMIEASETLAVGIPFVRVDFYEVAGRDYFGEMTFYPGCGFEEFDPHVWDERLGSWLELPGGGLLVGSDWLLWLHGERPCGGGMASESAVAGAIDYKFFCFNGEPRFLYVSQGLEVHATARMSFLSLDWEPLPFDRDEYRPFEVLPSQPESMGEMIRLARELSCGIPHVRVDFLERHGRPVLSEMTFYNCSGYMHLVPPEWDLEIGAMLRLPNEEAT